MRLTASTHHIFYHSVHTALLKTLNMRITILNPETGKPSQMSTLASDTGVMAAESIFYTGSNTIAPCMIWVGKGFKSVKIHVLGGQPASNFDITADEGEQITRVSVHNSKSAAAKPHFLIYYETSTSYWAEVYHVDDSKPAAIKAFEIPKAEGKAAFSASNVDSDVYFTAASDIFVSLYSSNSAKPIDTWAVKAEKEGGYDHPEGVAHSVSESVSKGGSRFAIRSALTFPSGDWQLIRNADAVWSRPESLAGIAAAVFADIPKEENLAKELYTESHGNVLAAYIHRIKRHAKDMEGFPDWLGHLPYRISGGLLGDLFGNRPTDAKDKSLRPDGFGLRKMVIVATRSGRIAAIDTGFHGEVIWNVKAVNVKPGENWQVQGIVIDRGVALIQGAGAEMLRVDTLTGEILQYQPGGLMSLKTLVPVLSASGERILLPINLDGSPGDIHEDLSHTSTILVTQRPDGSVTGWGVEPSGKPILAWEFSAPTGEEISSITTRPSHDPVASIGKALGDRNVLYKYLSPNLLLIITIGTSASTASVYLLDSITGQTLYTTTHSGIDTSKPIPATFSENWFAYSLYSDPALSTPSSQTQNTSTKFPLPKSPLLIVSELYESLLPNDRGPLGSAPNISATITPLPAPHVQSLSFVLSAPITILSTTSTSQGITPRSLLTYSPSLNAIISIPKPYIDPRRPIGRDPTTAQSQEEGLFRYTPLLDIAGQGTWWISHKRQLLGITDMITSPTALESTSLVFAFGDVDCYGTRVSPIGAFDLLGKGFSKLQLVGTVLALGLGTGVLAPLVRRKGVDGFWRS